MLYQDFINNTLPYNYFDIIKTNSNGTCCYDSLLKLLKFYNQVKPNLNTKVLQAQAIKWVNINRNLYLPNFSLTLEDLVLYTHNFDDFDDYIDTYKIYSGKPTTNTPDRWGGVPEIIAISNLYNINVNVYSGESYNKKLNKIIKGTIINNKPRKDFRFKLIMTTLREESNNTINILWTKTNKFSHFDALIN